jgi:hypothetical protein
LQTAHVSPSANGNVANHHLLAGKNLLA